MNINPSRMAPQLNLAANLADEALLAYQQGHFEAASVKVEQAIPYAEAAQLETESQFPAAELLSGLHLLQGQAQMQLDRFADALITLSKALDYPFEHAKAHFLRGQCASQLGNYASAIADYTTCLSLEPNLAQTYLARGLAFLQSERYPEGLQDLEQAWTQQPHDQETQSHRANALIYLGRYPEAITALNVLLQQHPQLAIGYYSRGIAYEGLELMREAEQDFQHAFALNPLLQMD